MRRQFKHRCDKHSVVFDDYCGLCVDDNDGENKMECEHGRPLYEVCSECIEKIAAEEKRAAMGAETPKPCPDCEANKISIDLLTLLARGQNNGMSAIHNLIVKLEQRVRSLEDAAKDRKEQEDYQQQHQNRDRSGETAEASGSDSSEQGAGKEEKVETIAFCLQHGVRFNLKDDCPGCLEVWIDNFVKGLLR